MKPSNSKSNIWIQSHYARTFLVHLQAMSCPVFFLSVLNSMKSISQIKDSEQYSGLFFIAKLFKYSYLKQHLASLKSRKLCRFISSCNRFPFHTSLVCGQNVDIVFLLEEAESKRKWSKEYYWLRESKSAFQLKSLSCKKSSLKSFKLEFRKKVIKDGMLNKNQQQL